MANVIRCDGGCGRESPDEKGMHVANQWLCVYANNALRWPDEDYSVRWLSSQSKIYCDECAKRVQAAMESRP